MTAALRDLVAATIAAHVDQIDLVASGRSELTCSCGALVLDLPAPAEPDWEAAWDPLLADFAAHRADAVLTALTEAGARVVGICGDRAADVFPNGPTRVCDLPAGHAGWHGAPNPSDASGIPSRMSWTVRDQPLVLTMLDDAPPGPRVWAMPESIPPTVNAVTDKHGRTFHRVDGSPFWWRADAEQRYEWPEGDLIQAFGPLTGVLPNGD